MMHAGGDRVNFRQRWESHQKGGSYYFATLSQVLPPSPLGSPLYIGVLGYPSPFSRALACIYIIAKVSQDIGVCSTPCPPPPTLYTHYIY